MARWFLFLLAILMGAALVVAYAWQINPDEPINAAPESLRIDYKTDYVLMVAEIYHQDGDIDQTLKRLTDLEIGSPLELVDEVIRFAEQEGYKHDDLVKMWALRDGIARVTLDVEQPSS